MPDQEHDGASEIASEIFTLMSKRGASNQDGIWAMLTVLVISLVTSDVSKENALKIFSQCWDRMGPTIRARWSEGDHG